MAAPIQHGNFVENPEEPPKHHVRQNICATRKNYRQGRRDTAVKVFTIHQESKYLIVQGVPSVGASRELVKLFALYGAIEEYRILDEYPAADEFTEVYWIKFKKIQAARIAKRRMDDFSFFGGVLHICYAPEYETVDETREKLIDRRKAIAARIRKIKEEEASEREQISDSEDLAAYDVTKEDTSHTEHCVKPSNPGAEPGTSHASQTCNVPAQNVTNTLNNGVNYGPNYSMGHAPYHQGQAFPPNMHYPPLPPPPPPPPPGRHPMANPYSMPLFRPALHRPQFDHARVPSAHATLPIDFNPFPESSVMYNNYHNRLVESSSREEIRVPESGSQKCEKEGLNERIVAGIVIRDYEKKGKQTPKFVPRQVKKVSNEDTKSGPAKRLKLTVSTKSDSSSTGDVTRSEGRPDVVKEKASKKRDSLDEELRRNAFILGPIAGPTPSSDVVERSEKKTDDESIEKSRAEIRERLKKFSTIAIPRQIRKKFTKKGPSKSAVT